MKCNAKCLTIKRTTRKNRINQTPPTSHTKNPHDDFENHQLGGAGVVKKWGCGNPNLVDPRTIGGMGLLQEFY